MEGVLVSAKRQGSTKTVTVVSNADGVYSFPRGRLEPGRYDVTDSRGGLRDPGAGARACRSTSRRRRRTRSRTCAPANILERALQMTDPEWLASYPLDDKTKFDLLRDCNRCHTLRRPSMSTYTKEQLPWVMKRMSLFERQLADDVPAARPIRPSTSAGPNGASRRRCTNARRTRSPRSICTTACGTTS